MPRIPREPPKPITQPGARPSSPAANRPARPADRRPSSSFVPAASSTGDANLVKLRSLLEGHTDRGEEKQIIGIFAGASAGELNGMLAKLPLHELHELIGDVDDRFIGPDNKTALLKLLSKDRLPELSTESRAKLVQALQHQKTGGGDEKAIRDIFLGTTGPALTALKNAIDSGVDYHDLQQLVFHDIDDGGIRQQILSHFAKESKPTGQCKVLSDIDDTFYASLKDDRYPSKTVYPGVRALYAELDKGGGAAPDRGGDLTFLSARPYDRAGVGEVITRNMLDKNGVRATIASGDFLHLVGNELIAEKKFDNFKQLRQLYPEYGDVMLGDSGQGDAILGAKAVAAEPAQVKAVFINNVTNLSAAKKQELAGQGITVVDTYVGAATEAFKRGLISREGLQRVAAAAAGELEAVQFSSPDQKAARHSELQRDLAAMHAALG
ncbi:MAG: phosphatase domain-containing protein [Myxococcaceae bacterium]